MILMPAKVWELWPKAYTVYEVGDYIVGDYTVSEHSEVNEWWINDKSSTWLNQCPI